MFGQVDELVVRLLARGAVERTVRELSEHAHRGDARPLERALDSRAGVVALAVDARDALPEARAGVAEGLDREGGQAARRLVLTAAAAPREEEVARVLGRVARPRRAVGGERVQVEYEHAAGREVPRQPAQCGVEVAF